MSDNAHDTHTGPIKTPSQLLWTSFFAFVAPIFIIIGLVYVVVSGNKPAAGAVDVEQATAMRIQRVGTVELRDANRPLASGESVYTAMDKYLLVTTEKALTVSGEFIADIKDETLHEVQEAIKSISSGLIPQVCRALKMSSACLIPISALSVLRLGK